VPNACRHIGCLLPSARQLRIGRSQKSSIIAHEGEPFVGSQECCFPTPALYVDSAAHAPLSLGSPSTLTRTSRRV
jgi:hypothetical protein